MITGEEWSDCFTLKDISLPANPFIGLSAMTGDVSDTQEYAIFDLISLSSNLSDRIFRQRHLRLDVFCHPLRRGNSAQQARACTTRYKLVHVVRQAPTIWWCSRWDLVRLGNVRSKVLPWYPFWFIWEQRRVDVVQ